MKFKSIKVRKNGKSEISTVLAKVDVLDKHVRQMAVESDKLNREVYQSRQPAAVRRYGF